MDITFEKRDEFKREKIAINLIKLIEADFQTSPMVVNGQWGSGKTEFAHKLINKIKSSDKKWNVIYIDAFRYDHVEDPLMVLITQITSSLPSDSPDKKELIKKAIPLMKVMGKVVGKAAVSWVLKQNADDIGEDLSEALTEGGESVVDLGIEKAFSDFEKVEESLKVFKDVLAKIALTQKLVICIDELDRCRPPFALSLLEKIKHVFDIKNIEFIFMANLEQVEAMVKKQYGYTIDAETYLTKFFPVSVKLPSEYLVHGNDYNGNAFKLFSDKALLDSCLKKYFQRDNLLEKFFEKSFQRDNLSLRDSERFFQNILIYNTVSNNPIDDSKHVTYVTLWMLGIYISTFKIQIMQKILDEKLRLQDVSNLFNLSVEDFQKGISGRDFSHELFAMFILDLTEEDVKIAIPDNENLKKWQESVLRLFNGLQGSAPSRGERINIVKGAIKSMQLF